MAQDRLEIVAALLESVCSDGNSDARRLAQHIIDALYADTMAQIAESHTASVQRQAQKQFDRAVAEGRINLAALDAAPPGAADGKQSLPTEAPPADERETVETRRCDGCANWKRHESYPGGWCYGVPPALQTLENMSRLFPYTGEDDRCPNWSPISPTIAQGGER